MHLQLEANLRVNGVKDVHSAAFISAYAKHLKESGQFEAPKWLETAKTSCAKELVPVDPDFIYIRAAAIMRRLDRRPDPGVGRFRTIFGSTQNRGGAPSHHRKAGAKIIRHCLQQLEKMGLLRKDEVKGNRVISKTGQSSIDQVARQLQ